LLSIDNGILVAKDYFCCCSLEMSEGELLDRKRGRYYGKLFTMKSVEKSTLIAACCALGAKSVIEDEVG
jgi:octaprenyl-diphosphate synthase